MVCTHVCSCLALVERSDPPDGLAHGHVLEEAGLRHVVGVEHVELRRGQQRRYRPPDTRHLPHLQHTNIHNTQTCIM